MTTLKKNDKNATYHHGDLRNTLIRVGTEMLAEAGEAELSLRKLAKRVGVSHNAPYQHFSDKNALLAAIAEEGFRILSAEMDAVIAIGEQLEPQAYIMAASRAYVTFAIHHASHLQVMFGPLPPIQYPTLYEASVVSFGKLIQVVKDCQARGYLKPDPPEALALLIWIQVHGLSAILNANKLPPHIRNDYSTDELVTYFTKMLCAGLEK